MEALLRFYHSMNSLTLLIDCRYLKTALVVLTDDVKLVHGYSGYSLQFGEFGI